MGVHACLNIVHVMFTRTCVVLYMYTRVVVYTHEVF